jgi:hypothetical protein
VLVLLVLILLFELMPLLLPLLEGVVHTDIRRQ